MKSIAGAFQTVNFDCPSSRDACRQVGMATISAELHLPSVHGGGRSVAALEPPTVFVVPAGGRVQRSLQQIIETGGFAAESCGTVEELCAAHCPSIPHCVVLDVSSGGNGLDAQRQITAAMAAPIVFITRRPDVREAVLAMKAGAVDVLAEPVNPEQLWSAIRAAIVQSQTALARDAAVRPIRERYNSLTAREREVMGLVASGLLNKHVASELGISEITVKAHRGRVMAR